MTTALTHLTVHPHDLDLCAIPTNSRLFSHCDKIPIPINYTTTVNKNTSECKNPQTWTMEPNMRCTRTRSQGASWRVLLVLCVHKVRVFYSPYSLPRPSPRLQVPSPPLPLPSKSDIFSQSCLRLLGPDYVNSQTS